MICRERAVRVSADTAVAEMCWKRMGRMRDGEGKGGGFAETVGVEGSAWVCHVANTWTSLLCRVP